MSQENLELVRGHFEAFNAFMRSDMSVEAYRERFDPAVELNWHDQRTYPDTPQRLHGAAEIAAFSERYRDEWAEMEAEVREMSEPASGRVLALTRQSGRARGPALMTACARIYNRALIEREGASP